MTATIATPATGHWPYLKLLCQGSYLTLWMTFVPVMIPKSSIYFHEIKKSLGEASIICYGSPLIFELLSSR
jgi:hypothetical protein